MATIKLARYKFVARLLSSEDVVLDVGCGEGTSTNFISKYTKKVYGIDKDIKAILRAKHQYPQLDFIVCDALNFVSKIKFDAIVMIDFIEHFDKDEGELLMKIYSSLLSERGLMIIGTPNKNFYHYRSEQSKRVHKYEYNPEELMSLMKKYFQRTFFFSMNDELIHTGNLNLAWFIYGLGVYKKLK